jgi:hypothetical protein
MTKRFLTPVAVAATLLLSACGGAPPAQQAAKPAAEQPAAAPAAAASAPAASMPRSASPPGAMVMILSPTDGEKVKSPVTVRFAIKGMTVAPAGTSEPNTGHYHLLVDAPLPEALDRPIAKDEHHVHFGKAQTEGQVELAPGEHTLQLLLSDGNHVPHDPPVYSQQVKITVE